MLQAKAFRGSATAFLLTALAVVDSTCLCVGLLHHWLIHLADWNLRTLSDSSCRLHVFFTYLCVHLSAWTLVLVTAERVVSVLLPLAAPTLCSRRRLATVWFLVLLVLVLLNSILHLGYTQLIPTDTGIDNQTIQHWSCDLRPDMHELLSPFRVWGDLILSSLLPSVIIFCGNIIVLVQLSKLAKKRREMQSGNRKKNGRTNKGGQHGGGAITVMLVTVCLVFLLTSLPINVYLICDKYELFTKADNMASISRQELIFTALSLFYFVNNAINFLLYFISGPSFRKAAQKRFCCGETQQGYVTATHRTRMTTAC